MSVRIDIACNDPDNGLFAGRAQMIQVNDGLPEPFLEFEPFSWFRPPKIVEIDDGFRLAGKSWPIVGMRHWYGNWCWNAYLLDLDVAVDFVLWLRRRRLYRCTCGQTDMYEWWNRGAADIEPVLLRRILGKKHASAA